MLIGIHDKETGKDYHICGGFPSASGKTNLAMMLAPDALGDRYHVSFYGDDIAWLWVDEADGRLYGMNPEYGVFGVAKDTNEGTNPTALASVDEGTGAIFTNVAYNADHRRGLVGGPHARAAGRRRTAGWTGRAPRSPTASPATTRRGRTRTAGSPPRWTTSPTSRPTTTPPAGVPIDAIIFGGRTRDREPLIRAITDLAEGVYDGLTLGAEATSAAEGMEGVLRYDPMSNRPFMAYGEGDYAAHYLKIVGAAKDQPIFAHVNWFQRDPEDGHFLWPGYRDNLRPLLWLLQLKNGEVKGRRDRGRHHPDRGGAQPRGRRHQRRRTSRRSSPSTWTRWQQEMGYREEHLASSTGCPRRSGRRTAGSPRPSRQPATDTRQCRRDCWSCRARSWVRSATNHSPMRCVGSNTTRRSLCAGSRSAPSG